MATYYFDCETDGLLDTMTKLHSLVLEDKDTGGVYSAYNKNMLETAVRMLMDADEIIGHNIIKFDIPALQIIYPWFKPKGKITDTLVLSRLVFTNLYDKDVARKGYPSYLTGSHGLEAWGYRLGLWKGDYAKIMKDQGLDPWAYWSQEMQDYCVQDVKVTRRLHDWIIKADPDPKAVWIEHAFCHIIQMQEQRGFSFDEEAAYQLYGVLVKKRVEIASKLVDTFPPIEKSEVFIPKVNNKTRGYVKGEPFIKRWMVEFNPSSRQMIAERLQDMGWKPNEFTPSGQPKIDETILMGLPYPEAQVLAEHFLIEKRIGQLAEGDQAWLKLVKKGKIHGSVNTNGAVTGRCTHSNPNVAQTPSVGAPYGSECRALFTSVAGWVLVGADLSGLELRCLAHFMALFDSGEYGRIVVDGDIHTVNQLAAGLPTRNSAKTFIYAFLYGAGDAKIGSIVEPMASEKRQKQIGKALKAAFLEKTPALKKLREVVKHRAEKFGFLRGLDGRKLHIRSSHAALNTLLQSAGALISKASMIFAYQELSRRGYVFGKDYAFVAHIHDEIQTECKPKLAQEVGEVMVWGMQEAGRYFDFKCPITGEFKIGNNWKETH